MAHDYDVEKKKKERWATFFEDLYLRLVICQYTL